MKKFKLFLNPVEGRENWLNRMAQRGYRLSRITSLGLVYEFEKTDVEYEYKVQYIGYMANDERIEYEGFLKDLDYGFWIAALNTAQVSFGRAKYRPFARRGGKIATSPGMINKELIIIERKASDSEFKVFSDVQSSLEDLRFRRRSYIYLLGMIAAFMALGYYFNNIKPIFKWTWISYNGFSSPILIAILILLLSAYILYFIIMLSFEIKHLKESPYQ